MNAKAQAVASQASSELHRSITAVCLHYWIMFVITWAGIFLPAEGYADAPSTQGTEQTPDAVRRDDKGPDKWELPVLQRDAISL